MHEVEPLELSADHTGSSTVVTVAGEIDLATAPQFGAFLRDQLAHTRAVFMLDLSGVESADVSALRMIAVASRQANNAGHRLSVVGVPPRIRRLLLLTHLRGLILIDDDVPPRVTADTA